MRRIGKAAGALCAWALLMAPAHADALILSCALEGLAGAELYRIEPRGAWQTWNAQTQVWDSTDCSGAGSRCENNGRLAVRTQVFGPAVGARAYRRVEVNLRTNAYRVDTWADRLPRTSTRRGACTPADDPAAS